MKYILTLVLGLGFCLGVQAQLDRSKAPEPGPAPKIQIGDYNSFTLKNGLTVIVVENHKIPRVSFSLLLDRGPIFEGEKAGYVSMAGQLLRRGTMNMTKDQLDEEIDFIGASISTGSSSIFGSSLTKHKIKVLDLMTDILYNPSFPEEELEKIKTETLSGLKAGKDDPNSIASNISSMVMYGPEHPYGEVQIEEHVENITIEDCKAYYKKYFVPGIAYLAIVGDIKPKEAKKLAKKYFGKWQGEKVEKNKFDLPVFPSETSVSLGNKSGAVQTVLRVSYPVELKLGEADYIPARLMNQILGSGFGSYLNQNLREDKGYTYGAGSSLSADQLIGSFSASASVRTEVTDSAVTEFFREMNRIRDEKVDPEILQRNKNVASGRFARSLEQPQTVANFALNTVRLSLPTDYYETYLENLNKVTAEDIQRMAKKYIHPDKAHVIAVGNATEIKDKLGAFGKVSRYDAFGMPEAEQDMSAMENTTAEAVLSKYLEAIGGKADLNSISSITMEGEVEVQGQKIGMTFSKKSPGKFIQLQKLPAAMGGATIKTVYNGEKAMIFSPMGNQEITGPQLESTRSQGAIFFEKDYGKYGLKAELSEMKKIDDKEVFVISFKNKEGTSVSTRSYAVESGLLVEEINAAGKSRFEAYEEVKGILFPHTIFVQSPMGELPVKFTSIEPNAEITDDIFSIE